MLVIKKDQKSTFLGIWMKSVSWLPKSQKRLLKFQTVGGWWGQVMLAQQVQIKTTTGKVYHGVIGSKPPHVLTAEVRNKPYEIADMFIDIGASNDQQVAEWGFIQGYGDTIY